MNKSDARKIIENENLKHYNWFGNREVYPYEVSISKTENSWSVFTADERTCKISEAIYDNENDALTEFIKRLRADKKLA